MWCGIDTLGQILYFSIFGFREVTSHEVRRLPDLQVIRYRHKRQPNTSPIPCQETKLFQYPLAIKCFRKTRIQHMIQMQFKQNVFQCNYLLSHAGIGTTRVSGRWVLSQLSHAG